MTERYDLIVIGAGIHGAGIAQAAAAAGYKTLVLEARDVAAGTSSQSSKLIHGGLRYLETFQFRLVRECLKERELLLRLAPELIRLKRFHIPRYRQTSRSALALRAGLSLYSLLGGLGEHTRFQSLPESEWPRLDGLTRRDLRQVFCYRDAQTDDARLTRAVLHSACHLDAELRMPASVQRLVLHDGGCEVTYRDEAGEHIVSAAAVANCTGAWGGELLSRCEPVLTPPAVELVQGSHLLLDVDTTDWHGIYYLEAPRDRRAVFAMPWHGRLLLGTTETPYRGDPAGAVPTEDEIAYLRETLARYFPTLTDARTLQTFCGLRVLPAATGSAFTRSREDIYHVDREHNPRLLTLMGGKLTSYRLTALRALQRLAPTLPERQARADTAELKLDPAPDAATPAAPQHDAPQRRVE